MRYNILSNLLSDLHLRPMFHYKEQPILLHVLVCFMALVISKHIEIKTNYSIKKFVNEAKKITDARLYNKITNKEVKIRTEITNTMTEILKKLNLSH